MGSKLSTNEKSENHCKPSKSDVQEFIKGIKPLDLLVFKGTGVTSNVIIKAEEWVTGFTDAPSHVEVMITKEWCDKIKTYEGISIEVDQPLSWGSTTLGKSISIETGGHVNGVQIRDLEYLITKYLSNPTSNVGYCSLRDNPTQFSPDKESLTHYLIRKDRIQENLRISYDKYHDKEYNNNPLALIGVMFPQFRYLRNVSQENYENYGNDGNGNKLFCSEFIATLYEDLGIINDMTDGVADGKMLDPRDVLPVDFFGPDADRQFVNAICNQPVWFR